MTQRLFVVGGLALLALAAGGLANGANAGVTTECASGDPHVVCLTYTKQGQLVPTPSQVATVKAGTSDVTASNVTYNQSGDYDYNRTTRVVTVDGAGVTVNEDHYDSSYYVEAQSWNEKRIDANGYHEHEDSTFYGPSHSETGSFDQSLTADGYERTQRTNGDCTRHLAVKTDGTVETGCP